ncbi:hypothetical protein B0H16DRAFT_1598378 [Mycena metata]|uniref:Uncharacterized protein n=1 Tax=Mycena metata TaxID=1033252 RepID=A0AAD7HLM8_9AGAR|nr:hypothetical protein B0H16DRAFT_1598378 [Mycena metata]
MGTLHMTYHVAATVTSFFPSVVSTLRYGDCYCQLFQPRPTKALTFFAQTQALPHLTLNTAACKSFCFRSH